MILLEIEDRIKKATDWMLNSGIQNSDGEHKGGINSYHTEQGYPYIYSEITGYGVSAFLYASEVNRKLVERAKLAADWLIKKALMSSGGVRTRYYYQPTDNIYSFESGNSFPFDTAMGLYGLVMLYNSTRDEKLIEPIRRMADFIVSMQREDGTFDAYVTSTGEKVTSYDKWSNQPSPFHSKLSLGLLEAGMLLDDENLVEAAIKVCERSMDFMDNGRFITRANERMSDTHPNCYSAEGLLYSGMELERFDFMECAAFGVDSIVKRFYGKLPCAFDDVITVDNMRIDTVAQTLRLSVILKKLDLLKTDKMEQLYNTLVENQIVDGKQDGGFVYGTNDDGAVMNHPNSWVSMFALQAMIMYKDCLDGRKLRIKPFV